MHTYIKYGTINDVMHKVGTFVSPTELSRTAKQMVDEDLRVKGLENVRNFTVEDGIMSEIGGFGEAELMMSHWLKVK